MNTLEPSSENTTIPHPLSPTQIIAALNEAGFRISIFQGSYSFGRLVDTKAPLYLWHGSIYSEKRHRDYSKVRSELSYEEKLQTKCFFYHLVVHHKDSFEECLLGLWQQYLLPTVPPRPERSSLNPAFRRFKKERPQPITDDDLLA